MGQQQTKNYNFEDVQHMIKSKNTVLINVLPDYEQSCLIQNTLDVKHEVSTINEYIKTNKNINIIVYGRNSCDLNTEKKHKQLTSLGFYNVFIYRGGMFEWLLLQDIYGRDDFPTTTVELDILKFKSPNHFYNNLLTDSLD
jgi:rhodanese-related sulfurtransferase